MLMSSENYLSWMDRGWLLDTGYWMLDTQCSMLVTGPWFRVTCHLLLEMERCKVEGRRLKAELRHINKLL